MNPLIEQILKKLKENFRNDDERLNHILSVCRKAVQLARFYKVDIEKAQIASLLHDYTKNESLEFHLSLLNKTKINKYKQAPFIYHAFSAAICVKKEFNIKDRQILNAIQKHVWGHINMSKLDKIIFISDKIEDNRNYPNVDYLRKLSLENLNKTIYYFLKLTFSYYKENNFTIFSEQLKVFDFFKNKVKDLIDNE
ncbi:hydrolase [Candidatus Phytoplasma ziziphi]|uniref:Hydrolase n=1 Tax=Ziziphus jujuba witches'-broom phytoplasma TaxID=135727 RepID=A0A660HM74_ZIZJU|nr:bis(5'-nucleosyl)-tetraphosphatase (symmetrical) YqeK [Candidatus Phytoplasma ziziphi]AYJ01125.1 hydrolase [Candidatus Phytoplasma ziziphi]